MYLVVPWLTQLSERTADEPVNPPGFRRALRESNEEQSVAYALTSARDGKVDSLRIDARG